MTGDQADQKAHVIYNVLARTCRDITRCADMAAVLDCVRLQAKYLFEYTAIRLTVHGLAAPHVCFIPAARVPVQLLHQASEDIYAFERETASRSIPATITGTAAIAAAVSDLFPDGTSKLLDHIWVWPFHLHNSGVLTATVFSGRHGSFGQADMPVFKILCETIANKLRSLLIVDELNATRTQLQHTLAHLSEKNKEIQALVDQQDQIIASRTFQLEQRNTQLSAVLTLHVHHIREPLTRILALAGLSAAVRPDELMQEVMPGIIQSAGDLDHVIKKAVKYIEEEQFSDLSA